MKIEAYVITTAKRQIDRVEIEADGTADYYRYLECEKDGFCLGHIFDGDPLYIAENGLRKPSRNFFQVVDKGHDLQPLPGNGLMTGRDRYTRGGDNAGNHPIQMTITELHSRIRWMSRAQADAWAAQRGREGAVTINGEIMQTWEQFWRDMPEAPDEPPVRLFSRISGTGKGFGLDFSPFRTVWAAIDFARSVNPPGVEESEQIILGSLVDDKMGLLLTQAQLAEIIR